MSEKLRVGVLFGGRSGEHDVSLMSVQSVLNAIDKEKYAIVPIGIDHAGCWIFDGDPLELLVCGGSAPPGSSMWPQPDELAGVDVIIPVLHGTYGEDGTLQGFLDMAGIPYVGCGVLASALAMDKAISKSVFAAAGLPQTPWVVVLRRSWERDRQAAMDAVEASLNYPVFTKPANLGSSVGICRCENRTELEEGLDTAALFDRKIVIEQGVENAREIEVSVLGNDSPIASVPGEILPSNDYYDYAAKYLDGASRELIPAPLTEKQTDTIQRMAVQAFLAVDGSGLGRVDFLLNDKTGEIFFNEINTIPGFTEISMYPKLWEAGNLSYSALLDRLIELALERHQEIDRNQTTYTSGT